ncbi:MAG: PsbP-related protein, partial [Nitrososphaeraceae archaeon]|nr:PsbP-related protein [Nitrososphaeraceae archaeon]
NDADRASVYMDLAIDELSARDRNTGSGTTQTSSIDGKPIASENFLPYENSVFGIKIDYPDNWSVRTYPYDLTLNNTVVGFYSPSKTASQLGNISGVSGLFVPYLDVFVFSSKNNTLERIIDEKIKRIQNSTFYSISQSEPYMLIGNQSAYTLIYSTTVGKEELFKKIQVYTIFDGKVYLITFTSQDALFSDYLPVAKKMIDSFQVRKS